MELRTLTPSTSVPMVMPQNITTQRVPMMVSVVRALRHSGTLKARMPSLIASIPVSAEHPEEKALRKSRTSSRPPRSVKFSVIEMWMVVPVGWMLPVISRKTFTVTVRMMAPMKR